MLNVLYPLSTGSYKRAWSIWRRIIAYNQLIEKGGCDISRLKISLPMRFRQCRSRDTPKASIQQLKNSNCWSEQAFVA